MNAYNGECYCPGGHSSQSGVATKERYPTATIRPSGKTILEAQENLDVLDGPFILPVWNSHQGQIKAAMYFWECIEGDRIKVLDLWPKSIEFWLVKRMGAEPQYQKVGSVVVARSQCSGFLRESGLELIECALTTEAFEKFEAGAEWDAVLIAPDQVNGPDFEVVSKKNANPNNFTSFIRFASTKGSKGDFLLGRSGLTAVKMPAFRDSLGDIERGFFEEMLGAAQEFSQVPRLIFVFNRDAQVGLLFEGGRFSTGDFLDAEQIEEGVVSVYENAGALEKAYTAELQALFEMEFPALIAEDFIVHQGVNACLFACPPLGLYTHGYSANTVEPVVRFYISRLFQAWYDGAVLFSSEQDGFFEKYQDEWLDKGLEFFVFKSVGAEEV